MEWVCPLASPAEAVEQALSLCAADGGPVVLPDMSDNPGGGGTSDSIVILSEFLARGVRNCVIATIVDPVRCMHAPPALPRPHCEKLT